MPPVMEPSPTIATTLYFSPDGLARRHHAQRRGDRGARMPGAERVVLALGPLEEAAQSFVLPDRVQTVLAAGQDLVRIGLMPDIPHELVVRAC